MKLLLDESLPEPLRRQLLDRFPESIDVANSKLKSSNDQRLYEYASTNQLAIVSMDRGFANIIRYPPENLPGIIVIRPKGLRVLDICRIVSDFLTAIVQQELDGCLVAITKQSIRKRSPK